MKIKKEFIILALVIVGLVIYLIYQKRDRTQYALPHIAPIVKNQISKLELGKSEGTIHLERKDEKWYIGPRQYPADAQRVNSMLQELEKLHITTLVSESKKYARYDLNQKNKISVKAWVGSKLSRQLDIGKTANTYRHTFIRLATDPNVYHAGGDIRYTFDQTLDSLRDKTVLAFDKKHITELALVDGDRKIMIRKSEATPPAPSSAAAAPSQSAWQTQDDEPVAVSAVETLLTTLSTLKCERYIEDRQKAEFENPVLKVDLKGSKSYALSIFAKTESAGSGYPGLSSQNDYPFSFSETQIENIKTQMKALWPQPDKTAAEGN